MSASLRGILAGLGGHGAIRAAPAAGRALAGIAGILAFLAVVVLALGLAAHRLMQDWTADLAGTATLQVLADDEEVEAQARAALEVLRETPGVRAVRIIGVEEQRALLEPWLGAQALAEDLPLPVLIEVSTDPRGLDLPALRARLAEAAPGAVYDDPGSWRAPLADSARRVRQFSAIGLGLLAAALLLAAGLAASSSTVRQSGAIETLRLIGARDSYILRGLSRPLLLRVLAGAAAGTVAALVLLAFAAPRSEAGFFLAAVRPEGWQWLLPLAVVPASGLIAWIGAGWAVRRGLRRWS